MTGPSYHDLHVTTANIPRTRISDLPFGVEVTCNRVGGWSLWSGGEPQRLLGSEYGSSLNDWLVLDVAGTVLVDSRPDVA